MLSMGYFNNQLVIGKEKKKILFTALIEKFSLLLNCEVLIN